MNVFSLPTGFLFTDDYERGQLETLSIGDYGKSKNIKADFLGFTEEINGVQNGPCMPLSEKWVITVSTQYGCIQKCTFCDVPKIRFNGNASFDALKKQLYSAMALYPNVKYTDRLNLHYARMGEPIVNPSVFELSRWLVEQKRTFQKESGVRVEVIHPVMTTSLPNRFKQLESRIMEWCEIKNDLYRGQAGFQFSINTTDEESRIRQFAGGALTLSEFAKIAEKMPDPVSRKYCLNFAYVTNAIVDAKLLASMFDTDKFMCKITPIHNNNSCRENRIETIQGYESYQPYRQVEESLKDVGFDTLVFVPSMDEECGLVTCGNAVLGGGKLRLS